MKRIVTLLLLTCLSTAHASDAPQRKPFVLETVLVDRGQPRATIVAPDLPEYQKLAEKVQSAVLLPIRRDSEFAEINGEPKSVPDTNVILLGNQQSSGLVTHLCFKGYCQVDTMYPGPPEVGYIIRTIHDPWGNGSNVILLAGSDLKGVSLAVDRFCAGLLWRRDLGEPILTLVTADSKIFAGTEDGHIFVLDAKGNTLAAWTAPGPIRKLLPMPNSRLATLCDRKITLFNMH